MPTDAPSRTLAALFLLADSRLPSGGHGHSGGVEALVERGLLRDTDELVLFLDARVRTAGLVAAAFAATACAWAERSVHRAWGSLDRALDARTPSAALREASRAQGSALLRTVAQAWPDASAPRALAGLGRPHHPLVLGAAVAAAGADPGAAAALAVHQLAGGAATAAVRLLGLDPLRVAAVQAGLAALADQVSARATEAARAAEASGDLDLLPADATPLPEIMAELHSASEVTLFAS